MSAHRCRGWVLAAVFLLILTASSGAAPSMIAYQGRLINGTNLVNGEVDMRLRVYDNPTAPIILWCEDSGRVSVVDGLYSTYLGDNLTVGDMSWTRAGGNFWIEVAINSVTMAPREQVVCVAYAMTAGGVTNGAIGTMELGNGAVMNANLANGAVDSAKISDGTIAFSDMNQNSATNGQIMKWNGSAWAAANDLTSGGGALASYAESGSFSPSPQALGSDSIAQGLGARTEGDRSTVGGGAYNRIGYAGNQAVIAGGFSNLVGDLAYNAVIGGGFGNEIGNSASKATLGGGFQNVILDSDSTVIGGGENNRIDALSDNSAVGGGKDNAIGGSSPGSAIAGGTLNDIGTVSTNSTIGGGRYNRIGGLAHHATIAGGFSNEVGDSATYGTVGGGYQNSMGNSDYSVIAGGAENRIENGGQFGFIGGGIGQDILSNASYAVIGGGQNNDISTNADWAVIPGGRNNLAAGQYSFAAGRRAQAMHSGTFVWADSQDADFASARSNTFLIRAAGGVGLGTAEPRGVLEVAGRIYSRGVTIEDESFVTVTTTSNDALNGLNLLEAYALATNMTPHGQPLGPSNRVAVLVPPGRYNMETGMLVLAAEYVDLAGLSPAREDQRVFGDGEGGCVLRQTADDVQIGNLVFACIRTGGGSRVAYNPDSDLSNTVVRNCRFVGQGGSGGSMSWSRAYAGTYEDCAAGDASFGSGSDGVAAGVFIRCSAGDDSFGGYGGEARGTFVECTGSNSAFGGFGGVATGLFTRCRGGAFSFGGYSGGKACGRFEYCVGEAASFGGNGGEASGVFIGCEGGFHAFGSGNPGAGSASGYFVDCQGGDSSFGSHYGSDASGTFINCVAGALSFGCDGYCSGLFIHCAAGDQSFGGNQDGILSGSLYHCSMVGSTWQGSTTPSKITGRLDGCSWGASVTIQAGARLYGSTFLGTIDGDGSGDCKIAGVRCQAINLGTLTNRIATPYNVIDPDVD